MPAMRLSNPVELALPRRGFMVDVAFWARAADRAQDKPPVVVETFTYVLPDGDDLDDQGRVVTHRIATQGAHYVLEDGTLVPKAQLDDPEPEAAVPTGPWKLEAVTVQPKQALKPHLLAFWQRWQASQETPRPWPSHMKMHPDHRAARAAEGDPRPGVADMAGDDAVAVPAGAPR